MSRWGVGPLFGLISLGIGTVAVIISILSPIFILPFPHWIMNSGALFLLLCGAILFIPAFLQVSAAYPNALCTSGTFSFCRHPAYAAWVFFFVPCIFMFLKMWLGIGVLFFMYKLAEKMVQKEEEDLARKFGSKYTNYMRKTPSLLPIGVLLRD